MREKLIASDLPLSSSKRHYWKNVNLIAKNFKLSTTTLRRNYEKAKVKGIENYVPCDKLKHRQVFSAAQEEILKSFVLECTDRLHGFTLYEAQKFAVEFACYHKISIPNSRLTDEVRLAGVEWMRRFVKRHPELRIHKVQNCLFPLKTWRCLLKAQVRTEIHLEFRRIFDESSTNLEGKLSAKLFLI